jgi:FMN phosphatase YigB (HAD superfamily)
MELHQPSKIELVLFDVGGVIIDLYLDSAREDLLKKYGMPECVFEEITRSSFEKQPWSPTERATIGSMTTDEYVGAFHRGCENGVSISKIKANLQSIVGPERREMVELIRTLSKTVRLAAFTNTIALHWDLLTDAARFSFFGLMEKVVASHILGLAKPMLDAYRGVCRILTVDPTNVLFIDDVDRNVLAAEEVGMTSVQYTTYSNLCETLRRLDLLKD